MLRSMERQQRRPLFWLLTVVMLLCIAVYPLAMLVAHYLDEAEEQPLVVHHTAR